MIVKFFIWLCYFKEQEIQLRFIGVYGCGQYKRLELWNKLLRRNN